MWNNSKSRIRYTWGKIWDCHIIEVEPCMGTIGTAARGARLGLGAGGLRAGPCGFMVPRDQLRQQPGTHGREVSEGQAPRPRYPGTCLCFLSQLSLPLPQRPVRSRTLS